MPTPQPNHQPNSIAQAHPDSHHRRARTIKVPARDHGEAIRTLEAIGSGSTLGIGTTFLTNVDKIRDSYNQQVGQLKVEIDAKRASGVSDAEIAPWATAERTRIARGLRIRQGPAATVALEARDWLPQKMPAALKRFEGYGIGGRTDANLIRKALGNPKFRASGATMDEWLISGSVRPNSVVSGSAARAGEYLRVGGKILLPLGIAASAYNVYKAPKGEKLQTAGVEGASWAGGALASEGTVALLLVLAPETGGLTLLAVAAIAGAGAGWFSGWGAHKLFFSNHPHAQSSAEQTGSIPAHMIQSTLPSPPIGGHR
jgi:hypothetical protein